jgi:hypothetical protein
MNEVVGALLGLLLFVSFGCLAAADLMDVSTKEERDAEEEERV